MVVDDDPEILNVISSFLRSSYEVKSAESGPEAIGLLDESIDVILLDRKMPGMTGDEFLRSIRDEGFDCPVGLVTAVYPDFDISGLSFDDYVLKPVGKEDLRETVESLLDREGLSDTAREYLSVRAKIDALAAVKEPYELDASDDYADLQERLASLEPLALPDLENGTDGPGLV